MGVLFAAGLAGMSEEVLDALGSLSSELDEDHDAIGGDVG